MELKNGNLSIPDIDTVSTKFMPLKVGNKFVYYYSSQLMGHYQAYTFDAGITKDTIIGNRKYFWFAGLYNRWVRVDSTTGSLYYYNPANGCPYYYKESLIDSLAAVDGDEMTFCGVTHQSTYFGCSSEDTLTIFSHSSVFKEFELDLFAGSHSSYEHRKYVYGFGLYQIRNEESAAFISNTTLKGCIIDGVVYGDTSAPIPKILDPISFDLSQNYPNPFNPVTTIKLSVPYVSHSYTGQLPQPNIKLSVYDITGRLIAELVNEALPAGIYEYTFDGSNLSSGIYFYQVVSGTIVKDRKKMVLLK